MEGPANSSAVTPPHISQNPLRKLVGDAVTEWRGRGRFPPGPEGFSLSRTRQIAQNPLPTLLRCYEEYGPIFSMRVLHARPVWMIGPEANQFVTVTHPENFSYRKSNIGDMIPLVGNGISTTDGDHHDRARAIMVPAFRRSRVLRAVDAMAAETEAAIAMLPSDGVADVSSWTHDLAMRIAMRSMLGLDPDGGKATAAAEHFGRALSFYGIDYQWRLLRGPGTPWRKMLAARRALDEIVFTEIEERRANPDPGRRDVLSLLIGARGEEGEVFTDREICDELKGLMLGGHESSAATIIFMLHELACHPGVLDRLHEEQDLVLGGAGPTAEQLESEMPYLGMVVDEVLRLYPPAWVGPRRAVRDFEFEGHSVPSGAYVFYSSWASHRLPEIFPDPERFLPDRFAPERKAALPPGAYVPFGQGSRICVGKRFGYLEVKLIVTMILQQVRMERLPGRQMSIGQMPTLAPRGGLPMRIRRR